MWTQITDFPGDPKSLTDGELVALLGVWNAQKAELIGAGILDEFDKRLRRAWAIETGIIEDVYTLDRGVTQTLIEKGIDAALIHRGASNRDSTVVARIIQDHYDALDGMFDFVAGRRPLSTSYIKELHAALLHNVDSHVVQDQFGNIFERRLEKGQFKNIANSPTRSGGILHEYAPPEHVASEMDELLRMHHEHEATGTPPEASAAWLHHRFTQIHPFADGNGRIARSLASLVFIRAGWFPLVITRDDGARYIGALEKADDGDLRPLIALFVEVQRRLLISAMEIGYDVRPVASSHDAVLAARDRLEQRARSAEKGRLSTGVDELARLATVRLRQIALKLRQELGPISETFDFSVVEREGPLLMLQMITAKSASLVLSFHGIGPTFSRLTKVAAYLQTEAAESEPLPDGMFLINSAEDAASASNRFSIWLERLIIDGLNRWRLTL